MRVDGMHEFKSIEAEKGYCLVRDRIDSINERFMADIERLETHIAEISIIGGITLSEREWLSVELSELNRLINLEMFDAEPLLNRFILNDADRKVYLDKARELRDLFNTLLVSIGRSKATLNCIDVIPRWKFIMLVFSTKLIWFWLLLVIIVVLYKVLS